MKLTEWWRNKRIWPAGAIDQLVGKLSSAFPPELENTAGARAKSLRRKGVEDLLSGVEAYVAAQSPGFIGRLLFARRMQSGLITVGYSPRFAKQVTTAVLAALTRPEKQAPNP